MGVLSASDVDQPEALAREVTANQEEGDSHNELKRVVEDKYQHTKHQ